MAEKAITKEQQRILNSQFIKDPNASNEKLRQLGIIINLPRNVVLKYFQQRRKWTEITKNFDIIRKDDQIKKTKQPKRPVCDSRNAVMTRSRTKRLQQIATVPSKVNDDREQRSSLPRFPPKVRSSLPKPDKWVFDDLGLRSNDQFTTSTPKSRPRFATSTPKPSLKVGKTNLKMKTSPLKFVNDMNLSEILNA